MSTLKRRDPWILRFHDLMPHRIQDVLLVSTEYDAFVLEEDGRLSERLLMEYSELNLINAPRIVHVSSPTEALETLRTRRFDLVLTTMRNDDPGLLGLSTQVKKQYPDLPVVLLVLDEFELRRLPRPLPGSIDRVFLWTGDTRILMAIVKSVEDVLNVEHDTSRTGVRLILVVEDSIRRYSHFLSMLYSELMLQSQTLEAEGLNPLHKLLRTRARPKILLATSYEEAWKFYQKYRRHILALISDIKFPRQGELDDEAGFKLVAEILEDNPGLPILLQSANPDIEKRARAIGCHFADKKSPLLLRTIRHFLKETLGFGDFVFRLPDRTEIARARDMYELEQVLRTVDARSLYYHASNNHFNVWLRARSMFDLADEVQKVQASDFADVEELRACLVELIHRKAQEEQEGVVADFSTRDIGPARPFVRLGKGSIGGKGRGLAFLHSLLARSGLPDAYPGLRILIPRTVVIATDEFDRFLEANGLDSVHAAHLPAEELRRRFLESELPEKLVLDLKAATADLRGPLAVRSSSLLEDSQHQSCAGVYDTCIVANNSPEPEVRWRELSRAIRLVYASTFSSRARAYLENTPFSVEDEKMAVVIQEVVGQPHGTRFYPHFSGVGLSYNFYPVGPQQPEDGVVYLALGLGHTIATGGRSVRFCPAYPEILPHLARPGEFLKYSQNRFYAVNLEGDGLESVDGSPGIFGALAEYDLAAAQEDGTLDVAASVYCRDDDQLRENSKLTGPRVVTFNNILKWRAIPLAEALNGLLRRLRQSMGSPVEIEFAVDMGDWGRAVATGQEHRGPCLYLLQVRPLAEPSLDVPVKAGSFPPAAVLCRSNRSLGHGVIGDMRDIIYVKGQILDPGRTRAVAEQVGRLNSELRQREAPYLLIGPGRWGSSDPSLGIPVDTWQITGARVIVEVPFEDREVEPSQGSHFFHELTSMHIGYLYVSGEGQDLVDWEWLSRQPAASETEEVRHVRLEEPLTAYLDGRLRQATILKPGGRGESYPGAACVGEATEAAPARR